jgi:hypothetical protein
MQIPDHSVCTAKFRKLALCSLLLGNMPVAVDYARKGAQSDPKSPLNGLLIFQAALEIDDSEIGSVLTKNFSTSVMFILFPHLAPSFYVDLA